MASPPQLRTPLLVALLTLQVVLIAGEIRTIVPSGVSLDGEWSSFPRGSDSALGGSAQLGARSAVLKRDVTGLVPGQTYRLSFRVKGDVSTSVALIFTVGASAIDTSTVDDGRVKVGYFVAAESSGTLAVSLFGKEDPAKSLLDGVRITPVSPSNLDELQAEGVTRRKMISVGLGDPCPSNSPNPCYNWDGSSKACCPDGCGINTGPTATCTQGCTSEAPNPCFNWNGQSMICCPGSCGPNGGPLATCAGSPATTPAPEKSPPVTSAPATSPPVTSPPITSPPATSPPKTSSPETSPPVTSPPVTSPPMTSPPATPPPATSPPETSPPVTSPPATSPPVTPPGTNLPPAPSGYRWVANPALTDEFNGDSLDTGKWQPIIPYYSGRLPSQYSTANVAVGGGYARLTSTTTVNDISQVANPSSDSWISAAALASNGAYAGLGYYEARMKASSLLMTSSFWFQSQHTETDVTETIGDTDNFRSRYMPINTHYYPNGVSVAPDLTTPFFYRLPDGVVTSGEFHTYGLWWQDAQTLHFFFDGQLATTITPAAPFTESQYLFFDTEVFSQYGLPSVADLKDPSKNVFLIDYVRAFYLVPTGK